MKTLLPLSAKNASGRSIWRRRGRLTLICGVAALLFGCVGYLTPAIQIGTTTATLMAQATCSGDTPSNPCAYWFQYWADGAARPTSTTKVAITGADTGAPATNLTNLRPGTLYHSLFCGYGDSNIPATGWWCSGPQSAGQSYFVAKLACQAPASASCQAILNSPDLSQTGAFRTGVAASVGLPAISGTADIGRVLSTADLPSSPITRDSGQSVQYASGKALWLFGDTAQYTPNGMSFLGGTTAAFGGFTAGQAPQTLDEVPTPGSGALRKGQTAPTPFMPSTTGIKIPGTTTACNTGGNYAPAWTSGAMLEDSGKVLITVGEVCDYVGSSGRTLQAEGFGVIEWDPASNSFTNGPTINTLFRNTTTSGLPAQKQLGHPVLGPQGGYVYLFSNRFSLSVPGQNGVFLARVPAAHAATATVASYEFWSDGTWVPSANFAQATTVIPFSGIAPLAISVGDYSATTNHHYVMLIKIIETGVGDGTGSMAIYSAPLPTGPWTRGPTVVVPDACNAGLFGCYAIEGHPELSSAGNLVYSYFSPEDQSGDGTARDANGHPAYAIGHLRLGTINW
jgi:hypothetical protein